MRTSIIAVALGALLGIVLTGCAGGQRTGMPPAVADTAMAYPVDIDADGHLMTHELVTDEASPRLQIYSLKDMGFYTLLSGCAQTYFGFQAVAGSSPSASQPQTETPDSLLDLTSPLVSLTTWTHEVQGCGGTYVDRHFTLPPGTYNVSEGVDTVDSPDIRWVLTGQLVVKRAHPATPTPGS